MSGKTDLSQYNNSWYQPGSAFRRGIWYFVNAIFFKNPLFPFSGPKSLILRLFGAQVGKGVVIKPCVNIKYPWKLILGNHVWVGEGVWIDNLDAVKVGNNVCISQGAMLLCGNHHYKKTTFDLIVQPIVLEDGVWIGAKSIVAPGVKCMSHSILTLGSVASSELDAYGIYSGNPALKVRARVIKNGDK